MVVAECVEKLTLGRKESPNQEIVVRLEKVCSLIATHALYGPRYTMLLA